MKLLACIAAAAFALAGCGNSGIEGTLAWVNDPVVSAHALNGTARNTTSHSVPVDPRSMRLLDADGRKVAAKIHVTAGDLGAGESTPLTATWKSGKPVRIDYGTGTLALPSD